MSMSMKKRVSKSTNNPDLAKDFGTVDLAGVMHISFCQSGYLVIFFDPLLEGK
jgi:hypothetical protein